MKRKSLLARAQAWSDREGNHWVGRTAGFVAGYQAAQRDARKTKSDPTLAQASRRVAAMIFYFDKPVAPLLVHRLRGDGRFTWCNFLVGGLADSQHSRDWVNVTCPVCRDRGHQAGRCEL